MAVGGIFPRMFQRSAFGFLLLALCIAALFSRGLQAAHGASWACTGATIATSTIVTPTATTDTHVAVGCTVAAGVVLEVQANSLPAGAAPLAAVVSVTGGAFASYAFLRIQGVTTLIDPTTRVPLRVLVAGNTFGANAAMQIHGAFPPDSNITVTQNTMDVNAYNSHLWPLNSGFVPCIYIGAPTAVPTTFHARSVFAIAGNTLLSTPSSGWPTPLVIAAITMKADSAFLLHRNTFKCSGLAGNIHHHYCVFQVDNSYTGAGGSATLYLTAEDTGRIAWTENTFTSVVPDPAATLRVLYIFPAMTGSGGGATLDISRNTIYATSLINVAAFAVLASLAMTPNSTFLFTANNASCFSTGGGMFLASVITLTTTNNDTIDFTGNTLRAQTAESAIRLHSVTLTGGSHATLGRNTLEVTPFSTSKPFFRMNLGLTLGQGSTLTVAENRVGASSGAAEPLLLMGPFTALTPDVKVFLCRNWYYGKRYGPRVASLGIVSIPAGTIGFVRQCPATATNTATLSVSATTSVSANATRTAAVAPSSTPSASPSARATGTEAIAPSASLSSSKLAHSDTNQVNVTQTPMGSPSSSGRGPPPTPTASLSPLLTATIPVVPPPTTPSSAAPTTSTTATAPGLSTSPLTPAVTAATAAPAPTTSMAATTSVSAPPTLPPTSMPAPSPAPPTTSILTSPTAMAVCPVGGPLVVQASAVGAVTARWALPAPVLLFAGGGAPSTTTLFTDLSAPLECTGESELRVACRSDRPLEDGSASVSLRPSWRVPADVLIPACANVSITLVLGVGAASATSGDAVVRIMLVAAAVVASPVFLGDPLSVELPVLTMALAGPCADGGAQAAAGLARYVLSPAIDAGAAAVVGMHVGIGTLAAATHVAVVAVYWARFGGFGSGSVFAAAWPAARFPGASFLVAAVLYPGAAWGGALAIREGAWAAAAAASVYLAAVPALGAWVLVRTRLGAGSRYRTPERKESVLQGLWRWLLTAGGTWADAAAEQAVGWVRGFGGPRGGRLALVPNACLCVAAAWLAGSSGWAASCEARLWAVASLVWAHAAGIAAARPYRHTLTTILSVAAQLFCGAAVALAGQPGSSPAATARTAFVYLCIVLTVARGLHVGVVVFRERRSEGSVNNNNIAHLSTENGLLSCNEIIATTADVELCSRA